MDENLADDEVEIELAPISVQLAYVRQVTEYFCICFFSLLLRCSYSIALTSSRSSETHKKLWSPILI